MSFGIYVHIPFCVSKCYYCNFYSEVKPKLVNDYVVALLAEIKRESSKYKDKEVDTIFIGGGTPSILNSGSISSIIYTIKDYFNVSKKCEITMEINPKTVNNADALEWFSCGVNRVSLGVQTTNNKLLKKIGRAHSYKDFVEGIKILQKVGFTNINADLMVGLPGQKKSDVKSALKKCLKLGVKHVSVYSLILEKNTPLYKSVKSGEVKLPSEDATLEMFNDALEFTQKKGLIRYEVSNFAYPNYECKHNLNCWNMHPYVGFGAAAHSFVNRFRYSNVSSIKKYIANINAKTSVKDFAERVLKCDLIEETIMLNLRTTKGIDLNNLKTTYNYDLVAKKYDQISELESLRLITNENGFIKATTKGFEVLNQIILKLVD